MSALVVGSVPCCRGCHFSGRVPLHMACRRRLHSITTIGDDAMSSRAVAVRSISPDCSSPSRVMFRGSIRRARSKTRLIEKIEGHRVLGALRRLPCSHQAFTFRCEVGLPPMEETDRSGRSVTNGEFANAVGRRSQKALPSAPLRRSRSYQAREHHQGPGLLNSPRGSWSGCCSVD
jgi:hypothetical protein